MKKFTICLLLLFCFLLTGCDGEKAVIAFSKTPFTKEKKYIPANKFQKGEKIYFAIYNPKGFNTRLLKLQVFKKDRSKSEFWAYDYLYNKTLELTNKNAFTDYVVINTSGIYIFQIFDFTDFSEPITLGAIEIE